jgi:hypothetical protein
MAFGIADDWAAVRSTTGAIAVLDIITGQPQARLPPASDIADDSPLLAAGSGEHIVEACSSGHLRVRRVKDLRVEYEEQHSDCMLGAIAATADLTRWAVAFNRKQLDAPRQPPCRIEVRGWPLSAGNRLVLGEEFGYVHAVAFGPGADQLAVLERGAARGENIISIVSATSGALQNRTTSTVWAGHSGFTWSSDGVWLVVGTHDGHALLDGRSLTSVGHFVGQYPSDASFSPNGQLLALGYWGSGLVLPVTDLRSWFLDRSQE